MHDNMNIKFENLLFLKIAREGFGGGCAVCKEAVTTAET